MASKKSGSTAKKSGGSSGKSGGGGRKNGTPSGRVGALSIGAILLAAGAAVFGVLRGRKLVERATGDDAPAPDAGGIGTGEHVPADLMGDAHPGPDERAVDAFRPDPTAPVPEGERDALRPATAPKPTLVAGSDVMEGRPAAGT